MAVTPEIEAEILLAHSLNPNRFSPFKVSKQVGATVAEVITTIRNLRDTPVVFEGGVARPELEPFIMASRRASEAGWNNDDVGVVEARRRFAEGTHDMATHRDGVWLHLCSFPLRRHRKPRPHYFTMRGA